MLNGFEKRRELKCLSAKDCSHTQPYGGTARTHVERKACFFACSVAVCHMALVVAQSDIDILVNVGSMYVCVCVRERRQN